MLVPEGWAGFEHLERIRKNLGRSKEWRGFGK